MGQLIIKYHSKNPGAVEIMTNVELTQMKIRRLLARQYKSLYWMAKSLFGRNQKATRMKVVEATRNE